MKELANIVLIGTKKNRARISTPEGRSRTQKGKFQSHRNIPDER